jgi:hypothetical protein
MADLVKARAENMAEIEAMAAVEDLGGGRRFKDNRPKPVETGKE